MSRYAIVGEAPSRTNGHAQPFDGRSGKRLADLLGVEHADLPRYYVLLNVVDRWPGRSSRGSEFPAGLARQNATALFHDLAPKLGLVLVGKRVAQAFGLGVDYFRWVVVTRGSVDTVTIGVGMDTRMLPTLDDRVARRVVVVPHPSGVNRWWNEPANEAKAHRFFRSLQREVER